MIRFGVGGYGVPNAQVVVGIAIAGYGLFVLVSSLLKIDAVKKQWREKKGDVVYVLTFSAAAIILGGILIVRGLDRYNLNFF
jgi:hypothetical protein